MLTDHLRFTVGRHDLPAILLKPQNARWLLVLGHGAGAGMTHPFLEQLASALAEVGVATLRYQFPYMEEQRRVPDPPQVSTATVRAAVQLAAEHAPNLPLLAGGKSFGGRMTSLAASESPLPDVRGLVFFGFPLHPAKRPSTVRAKHLSQVTVPMLFLQGTRDDLADLTLLRPVCERLPRATLHVIDSADHSFHVLKRSNRTDQEVLQELARTTAEWADRLDDQRG